MPQGGTPITTPINELQVQQIYQVNINHSGEAAFMRRHANEIQKYRSMKEAGVAENDPEYIRVCTILTSLSQQQQLRKMKQAQQEALARQSVQIQQQQQASNAQRNANGVNGEQRDAILMNGLSNLLEKVKLLLVSQRTDLLRQPQLDSQIPRPAAPQTTSKEVNKSQMRTLAVRSLLSRWPPSVVKYWLSSSCQKAFQYLQLYSSNYSQRSRQNDPLWTVKL